MTRLLFDTTFLVDSERARGDLDDLIDDGDDVAIAAVTIAELRVGALLAKRRRKAERGAYVDDVIATIPVLGYDVEVAQSHAELLLEVRSQGKPRGAHDLIIAATREGVRPCGRQRGPQGIPRSSRNRGCVTDTLGRPPFAGRVAPRRRRWGRACLSRRRAVPAGNLCSWAPCVRGSRTAFGRPESGARDGLISVRSGFAELPHVNAWIRERDARSSYRGPDALAGRAARRRRDLGFPRRARGEAAHELLARLAPPPPAAPAHLPAGVGAVGTGTQPAGIEHPDHVGDRIPTVERAFAFLDFCGFTRFTATHGEHRAIEALRMFRTTTRETAARRGVRVDKWLGDGAMIVGVEVGPTIATAVEIVSRCASEPLALRGGIAHGSVLILDGDDYIGRPINLAARLCEAAGPGELLAVGYPAGTLAPWIVVQGTRRVNLQGLGRLHGVQELGLLDPRAP